MTKRTKKSKRPSMKDVARLAGVSQTTVSFVVNNVTDANIAQETQDRVWKAVKKLGYRPNAIARALSAQRTHTIGFISDEVATTPYAGFMIQGAQDLAWQHGNIILLVNTGDNQDMKEASVNIMLDRQVDGIIYATMYHREAHPLEEVRQVPTVLLDCFIADRSLPSIVPDEVAGGREATLHLLKKNHRRIGLILDQADVPAKHGRFQGYKEALSSYQIPFDEKLVHFGDSMPKGGYDATMLLMQQPNKPTAIFCYNDRMAMGAYDALRKLGLSIPEDVAVVGFDNQELIATHLYPSLTTMKLPHYEMGQWAVKHLLELIENQNEAKKQSNPPVQKILTCPLIERAST
jgi:LacI family transcriptional regulator